MTDYRKELAQLGLNDVEIDLIFDDGELAYHVTAILDSAIRSRAAMARLDASLKTLRALTY